MSQSELTDEQRGELLMLGEQLGKIYGQKVKGFQELYKAYPNDSWIQEHYAPDKLHAKASEPISDENLADIWERPATDIRWDDLQTIAGREHSQVVEVWQDIKKAAVDYLASGQFAVNNVCRDDTPFERAVIIGIRNKLIDAWGPKDGIEMAMCEMLAQSFISYHYWLRVANSMTARQYEAAEKSEKNRYGEHSAWQPPQLSAADAIDRALLMADRFNKMFLRTLRQMRDLRRYSQPVIVQNAGQVNIAANGGQQVNVQNKGKKRAKDKAAAPGARRLKVAK